MSTSDVGPFHRSLLETASWRLCSELARRHPDGVRILELHPGGGLYDCLAVVTRDENPTSVLQANREGSIHVRPDAPEPPGRTRTWVDYLTAEDTREFLRAVERDAGLASPPTVPAATAATLSWRSIAAALAFHTLGVRQLTARNGYLDTSGYGGGRRDRLFDAFDPIRRAENSRGYDATDYWFLLHGEEPVAALRSTTADVWWTDGTCRNLFDYYTTNGRDLASTVAHGLAPALR